MESAIQRIAFVVLLIVPVVHSYIVCGIYECHGTSPYCCILDDGETGCCWNTFVYQLWWFWLIWVVIFFMVLGCVLACWRRRRAQYRYMVMANSEYPNYGTVVHASTTTTHNAYGPPAGIFPPPSAPVSPPSYAASEATKPPPYHQ